MGNGNPVPTAQTNAEQVRRMEERVAQAWDPILHRLMAPRNAVLQPAAGDQRQVSARLATMSRILTTMPLDSKERGVTVQNEDQSTCLPEGRVHVRSYDIKQFHRSELPSVGDEAQVGKLMVAGAKVGYDPDKFQLDNAFGRRLEQDEALTCSKLPLVMSEPVVTKPTEMLDKERCEVMSMLGRIVDFLQVVLRALFLKDAISTFVWTWKTWLLALDQRNELWARKMTTDGESSEMLLLRHTENSVVPFGLRQLSWQLEHDRNRFFRNGGGPSRVAPHRQQQQQRRSSSGRPPRPPSGQERSRQEFC
jgi:hypothetical protein